MKVKTQLRKYLGRKATKRLYKTMPWLNGAIALLAIGGMLRGQDIGKFVKDIPNLMGGLKERADRLAAGSEWAPSAAGDRT